MVSPRPKTPAHAASRTVAVTVPGTSDVAPSRDHATIQVRAMTTVTRVRRFPSMRCCTKSCRTTMTTVLAAKA